jgi:hypothetical protein
MTAPWPRLALFASVLVACSPEGREGEVDDVGDLADVGDEPDAPDAEASDGIDAGVVDFIDAAGNQATIDGGDNQGVIEAVVYAHTDTTLFRVDAETLEVTEVGPFVWPSDVVFEQMTDIAVTAKGEIYGVSFNRLYRVYGESAKCTLIAPLDGTTFNALSFIPGAAGERLVGASGEGTLYEIDTVTGQSLAIGSYGVGMASSGDVVSVEGEGTFATITLNGIEYLARVDNQTGAATPLPSPTGVGQLWGLGYWKGKVFGFSSYAGFVLIDLVTGVAVPQASGATQSWWGAGVTTRAIIVD